MNSLLAASATFLCQWLGNMLPRLNPDKWWDVNVVGKLSFAQQRMVEERNLRTIGYLDLSALLRILDQNWYDLNQLKRQPIDVRNWIKELQSVRNRWAHAPVTGLSADDSFRDADTLERLMVALQANDDLLAQIRQFKARVTPSLASLPVLASPPAANIEVTHPALPPTKYSVGNLVCRVAMIRTPLAIIEVIADGGETRYRVLEGGAVVEYYESQLQAFEQPPQEKSLSAKALSAMLTAVNLTSPSSSSLYSFNAGRVRFNAYQYRPVYKLVRADTPRLLIADEVGIGKTIEAGLILKELQARGDVKSVLIICPKALVAERKWEMEMRRFDEQFVALDGATLRNCIRTMDETGNWPIQFERAILPYSLCDRELLEGRSGKKAQCGLLGLTTTPKFDLIIVDEVHYIRNSETWYHKTVKYFCENAKAVVFLSATPIQLGRPDLFTLLSVLRPDLILDEATFENMAEPNQYINKGIDACRIGNHNWPQVVKSELQNVVQTSWGRRDIAQTPAFQHIYDALGETSESDAAARVKTIQKLEGLYTFSNLINRTRRRDIADGQFAIRSPRTQESAFTPPQQALHDSVLKVISDILQFVHVDANVKFMMTTISRQAASSLYGLAPILGDILDRNLDKLEAAQSQNENVDELEYAFIDQVRETITMLLAQAKTLDPRDPKVEGFIQILAGKVGMPQNNKVLVFSTFRHTLRYLEGKLEAHNSNGNVQPIRLGIVHGGIDHEERARLRKRFSLAKNDRDALDVLLSSEVGCEGLDFQFCDCLVNYDIPWNPMRIEQRIGRIDRYGQQSPTVVIFNLVTPGTIDAAIYNRCLMRIGVFESAIGGTEEILGDITKELQNIAEAFTATPQQREAMMDQLALNQIARLEESQRIEQLQNELVGLNIEAAASLDRDVEQSRNNWLEPAALATAISMYIKQRCGDAPGIQLVGDGELKRLLLTHQARRDLLLDFNRLASSTNSVYRQWEAWLRAHNSPELEVTFSQTCAIENGGAILLSLGHPLLQQAAQYLKPKGRSTVQLQALHSSIPPGTYAFAIHQWIREGKKTDIELVPIAIESAVRDALFDLIPGATDAPTIAPPSAKEADELMQLHYQLWRDARAEHIEENQQLINHRINSLSASHTIRKENIENQISNTVDDRIRTMKKSELNNIQFNFESRLNELQEAANLCDIRQSQLILGVIEIINTRDNY